MPSYQKASVIHADFDTVWEFYDGVKELEILMPEWVGLRIAQVLGPDDTHDQDSYVPGTVIHLETHPFGSRLFPEIEWVVEITERDEQPNRASFVDEQVGDQGPFERWRHEHVFVDLDGETLVYDRITYRVPSAGNLPLATPLLAGMLWYRHKQTRELLE